MAHIIEGELAEVLKDYSIYVIVSPFENTFFISKTGQNRLLKTYIEHANLRVVKTKNLFERARTENVLVPLYVLETGQMSKREAFSRCVAWTRYFQDHGYSQIKEDVLTKYASDLTEKTSAYYNKIKDDLFEEVLYPEGGAFPDYGKRLQQKDTRTIVSFALEPDEYFEIKNKAEENGFSMSAYCKKMSQTGRIIQADLSFIETYSDIFVDSKMLLRRIQLSIAKTGRYLPADMENIQYCVNQLIELEEKVNVDIVNLIRALRE